jgi:hypothetical protein
MTDRNPKTTTAFLALGAWVTCSLGCSRGDKGSLSTTEASSKAPEVHKENAEPKSQESKAVEPKVQAEIENMEAEKRSRRWIKATRILPWRHWSVRPGNWTWLSQEIQNWL